MLPSAPPVVELVGGAAADAAQAPSAAVSQVVEAKAAQVEQEKQQLAAQLQVVLSAKSYTKNSCSFSQIYF